MRTILVARISSGLLCAALLSGCNGGGSSTTADESSGSEGTLTPMTTTTTATDTTTDDATSTPTTTGTATTDDTTTSGGPDPVARRVFVTAAAFHGDLKTQGGGVDGVDGADLLCAAAATQSGLGGTWVAWVSSSGVDALSRLPGDARWTLIDGTTEVFPARAQIQFGPKHAIDMTEAGETLVPVGAQMPTVWTNTDTFGANSDDGQNNACDDWTGQTGVAAVGVIFDPDLGPLPGLNWTDTKQPLACGGMYHLYCFET